MDMITNYLEFANDIQESFAELINEFDLKFEQIYEGRYLLRGQHCILVFNYDRGDIFCEIRQPLENKTSEDFNILGLSFSKTTQKENYNTIGCDVSSVARYINGDSTTTDERTYDARLQLFSYAKLIGNKLTHVIKGDFEWLTGYLKQTEHDNKLFRYACNLDKNHPIKKKFWAGDTTWQQDIEKHLSDNNIVL